LGVLSSGYLLVCGIDGKLLNMFTFYDT
jgi:hypothetical protein